LLFSFLLLPSLLHAQSDLFQTSMFCVGHSLEPIRQMDSPIMVAVGIMIALIGSAYMGGKTINNAHLMMWSKTEAVTLVFSVIIMIVILGIFSFTCSFANVVAGLDPCENARDPASCMTPNQVLVEKLDEVAIKRGLPLAGDLVKSSINEQMDSMKYAYWSIPYVSDGAGMAYQANKRAWSAHRELLLNIYIPMLTSIRAQKMIFEMFLPSVAGILIPVGMFLRMIFVTRDAGNFLLAVSMAAAFVFPLVYIVSIQALEEIRTELLSGDETNPFGNVGNLAGGDMVLGDNYQRVAYISFIAVMLPNLALVLMITASMAFFKALKMLVG
jgi:F0F1-type ATP synthase membrane subunit c/vacuolar-type H+-ATPase subunit K